MYALTSNTVESDLVILVFTLCLIGKSASALTIPEFQACGDLLQDLTCQRTAFFAR